MLPTNMHLMSAPTQAYTQVYMSLCLYQLGINSLQPSLASRGMGSASCCATHSFNVLECLPQAMP